MATVYCDNCGTSLLEETAKFCRACGKPTPLSEAATKRFDEQPVVNNPTNPVGSSFTTPAYMAPFEMPHAEATNDLRQKKQKRNIIILVSMMAVMIIALAGLLVFLTINESTADQAGFPPPPPGAPGGPALPGTPAPPPPPPLHGIGGPSTIDPSLIYPGSSQSLSVNREGKSVLQLRSNDSVAKVAEWYIARLKNTKRVDVAGQVILKAGDIGVMIFGGDGGSQILITRGGEEN